jgi:hypothetical protein
MLRNVSDDVVPIPLVYQIAGKLLDESLHRSGFTAVWHISSPPTAVMAAERELFA